MPDDDFPFDESLLEDVAILLAHFDKLPAVIGFESAAGVGVYGLAKRIASSLGLKAQEVREILFAVSRMNSLREFQETDPKEYVNWITKLLESDVEKVQTLSQWNQHSSQFAELFGRISEDHPLMIATKAHKLVYTHENIFVRARLITDVRPVFDSTAQRIHDLVLTHMLSLEYTDGTQEQRVLSIAMDAMDVAALQSECERAATKILTLTKALGATFNTIVMPDLDDDEGAE